MSKLRKKTSKKTNKQITRNVKRKTRKRNVKRKTRKRIVKRKTRKRIVKINKKGGNKREIYLHFTCEDNRYSIAKSGLIPNAPALLDSGEGIDETFRPVALLKGYLSDNGNIEFEADDTVVLRILCFIAFDCCDIKDSLEPPILFYFEKNNEDELVKHPRMISEYQAYSNISPLRLREVNMKNWPKLLSKAVTNCGDNETCNSIYNR